MLLSIVRLLLVIAVAVALAPASRPALALDEARPACAGLEPGQTRTVARIIDGETVALDDGAELRLIGALAPRAFDVGAEPGTWPAEIAATQELQAMLLAKSVELAFGGERNDRYGRLQAQAYVREGEVRRWVQGHLLEQGLARAYTVAGNRACADALLAAEQDARDGRRGLWADAAYHVRPADKPSQLARYQSTFQLAEGRIAAVAVVRGTIYLNFDADWRHGFSAALRRADGSLLGAAARDPKALAGRLVRVRGWIERRSGSANGPSIELSTAGLIEVLEAPDPASTAAPPARRRGAGTSEPPALEPQETQTKPPGLVETGR
jgi:micrococcal nuclease